MITPPKDAKQINPAARDDGIQLPFYAPVIYWRNGDRALSEVGGVGHFGGWESQDFDMAFSERGGVPNGFKVEKRFFGEVWAARSVLFAPISARYRWMEKENKSHNQVLVVLATQHDGKIAKWGTAVLSYKGVNTKEQFEKATQHWETATRQFRVDFASGMQAWYFYKYIGTFGEFVDLEVGVKPKSSIITPMSLYMPKMSEKVIKTTYVGDDLYTRMSELHESAKEWANDSRWKGSEENLLPVNDDTNAKAAIQLGGEYRKGENKGAELLPRSALTARDQANDHGQPLSVDDAFPQESESWPE